MRTIPSIGRRRTLAESWVLRSSSGHSRERSGSYPRPGWGCQPASGQADHLAEAGAELIAPSASTIELGEQSFTFARPRLSLPCGSCVTAATAVADSAPSVFSVADGEEPGCRPGVGRGLRREL